MFQKHKSTGDAPCPHVFGTALAIIMFLDSFFKVLSPTGLNRLVRTFQKVAPVRKILRGALTRCKTV